MLGTSANRLHRSPHIEIAGNQIPAGSHEIAGFDLTADVDRFGNSLAAIGERFSPRNVTVPFYDRMRASQFERFFGIKSSVNSTKNYIGTAAARHLANLVAAQRVRGMNANADCISSLNRVRAHLHQSFIDQHRVSETFGSRGR
jgi:hypothetical protein